MKNDRAEDAVRTIEKASEILPQDKDILQIKNEISNFARYIDEYNDMEKDVKIRHEVAALIALEVLPSNEFEMNDEIVKEAMVQLQEYNILMEYNNYKTSIKKLEKNFPELYALKAVFFNKLTSSIERKSYKMCIENK